MQKKTDFNKWKDSTFFLSCLLQIKGTMGGGGNWKKKQNSEKQDMYYADSFVVTLPHSLMHCSMP